MWALVGLLIGALIGHALWREWGAIIGGLLGFFIGATLLGRKEREAYRKPESVASAAASPAQPMVARMQALEQRIEQLERIVMTGERSSPSATAQFATADESVSSTGATPSAQQEEPASNIADEQADPAGSIEPAADAGAPAAAATTITPHAPPPVAPVSMAASPIQALWDWFIGGNALTRIGVVVLFFGVGFLLPYLAEHFTLTIEVKLSLVAVAGAALIGIGLRLASRRPAYALSLQGAGAGILYLTTYAASQIYGVLPDVVAVALLIAISAFTVVLALRADSQALAGLAIAGAFVAPMVARNYGSPALLFGYFAIVNAAIFALAWRRVWRALNVLGFVCTFGLGLVWGQAYYTPEHFSIVQPFLILFFVFYVAIAILEARRAVVTSLFAVDGLLVFGVPLVGFILQTALVSGWRYGAAWSALILAAIYGALFAALRRRREAGLALLATAFLALAVIFATLAIPFAFDNEWTVALWAIEAAGVYWMGLTQRSLLARVFALLIETGAGVAFIATSGPWSTAPLFVNAHFIGTALIGLSGLATAFMADRNAEALTATERHLTALVFAWGAAWWFGGGIADILAHQTSTQRAHAVLAWVSASVALALVLRHWLRWPRVVAVGLVLLPAMALIALDDFGRSRTTLSTYGWLVFPFAWIVHAFALHAADTMSLTPSNRDLSGKAGALRIVHIASLLALTAQVAWEASEWVGRITAPETAWAACAAALPAAVCLWLLTYLHDSPRWPFNPHREAYMLGAGTPIAVLLMIWFVAANVLSPGDTSPLPHVPIANALELTLALVLAVVFVWAQRFAPVTTRTLYRWLGFGLFVALNGIVLRAGHHWGDIPWRLSSLLASKPLQAALTLSWTVTALGLMFLATNRRLRALWMVGAGLLALVVAKLFLVDLGALSGLPRIVSFIGVGALLLLIGYLSPLPPSDEKIDGEHAG